jgi:hypothetical protein
VAESDGVVVEGAEGDDWPSLAARAGWAAIAKAIREIDARTFKTAITTSYDWNAGRRRARTGYGDRIGRIPRSIKAIVGQGAGIVQIKSCG